MVGVFLVSLQTTPKGGAGFCLHTWPRPKACWLQTPRADRSLLGRRFAKDYASKCGGPPKKVGPAFADPLADLLGVLKQAVYKARKLPRRLLEKKLRVGRAKLAATSKARTSPWCSTRTTTQHMVQNTRRPEPWSNRAILLYTYIRTFSISCCYIHCAVTYWLLSHFI